MDTAKIGAIIIAIIMVGSIVGFGVGFLSKSQGEQPPANENVPFQNPTTIAFTAENVPAKVLELSPQFLFTAFTDEAEIYKIDEAIVELAPNSITGLASEYKTSNDSSKGSLIYFARIGFDSTQISALELFDLISNLEVFNSSEAYGIALVEIPKKVTFYSKELDLNKEYVFEDQLIQVFTALDTLKGDEIETIIDSQFQGQQLVQLLAFESKNLTAEIVQVSLVKDSEIVSLDEILTFSAKINFSNFLDENVLKSEILALDSVSDAEVSALMPSKTLSISIPITYSNKIEDLNAVFNEFTELNSFNFFTSDTDLNIQLQFTEATNLIDLKNSLKEKLIELGINESEIEFIESFSIVSGEIYLIEENVSLAANDLKSLLISLNFNEIELLQKGLIEEHSLTNPETEKVFSLDNNSIDSAFLPGHTIGDIVTMQIVFMAQREKVLFAQAVEKTD